MRKKNAFVVSAAGDTRSSGFALQRDLDKAENNEVLETGLSRLLKGTEKYFISE